MDDFELPFPFEFCGIQFPGLLGWVKTCSLATPCPQCLKSLEIAIGEYMVRESDGP